MSDQNEEMRERSGRIIDDRPLVAFLYLLLRDVELTVGDLELCVDQAVTELAGWQRDRMFTNGWLAQYAQDIADRLEGSQPDEGMNP